jgi:hypothetical protein
MGLERRLGSTAQKVNKESEASKEGEQPVPEARANKQPCPGAPEVLHSSPMCLRTSKFLRELEQAASNVSIPCTYLGTYVGSRFWGGSAVAGPGPALMFYVFSRVI